MGSWGDHLYDDDSALDALDEIVTSIALDASPAHLAAGLALRVWLCDEAEDAAEEARAVLADHPDWLDALPADVAAGIRYLLDDDELTDRPGGRSDANAAVLGRHCDGPRTSELLSFTGAAAILDQLAGTCVAVLDAATAGTPLLEELRGELAALGILLELSELGIHVPDEALARWAGRLACARARSPGDADHWRRVMSRVERALGLLRQRAREAN